MSVRGDKKLNKEQKLFNLFLKQLYDHPARGTAKMDQHMTIKLMDDEGENAAAAAKAKAAESGGRYLLVDKVIENVVTVPAKAVLSAAVDAISGPASKILGDLAGEEEEEEVESGDEEEEDEPMEVLTTEEFKGDLEEEMRKPQDGDADADDQWRFMGG